MKSMCPPSWQDAKVIHSLVTFVYLFVFIKFIVNRINDIPTGIKLFAKKKTRIPIERSGEQNASKQRRPKVSLRKGKSKEDLGM